MQISVAMCTYNGRSYLSEQLESLAAQERSPSELVVCDDGSTDGTLEILEGFAERAPFPVTIHRNPERLGVVKNFEKAMCLCTGDAIALCDQDDVWRPARLTRAAEVLEAEPEVGLTFSDADLIDETGAPMDRRLWDAVRFRPELRRRAERDGLLSVVLRLDVVTGATMTLRTRFRDLACPLPPEWPHDAWISLVCAFATGHRMFAEPLVAYRIHTSQETGVYSGPDDPGTPGPRGPGGLGGLIFREEISSQAPSRGAERRRVLAELAERNREVAEWFNRAAHRAGTTRPLTDPVAEETIATIEARAEHYRRRASLPVSRAGRVPAILGAWQDGGYERSIRGVLGALRDLVG